MANIYEVMKVYTFSNNNAELQVDVNTKCRLVGQNRVPCLVNNNYLVNMIIKGHTRLTDITSKKDVICHTWYTTAEDSLLAKENISGRYTNTGDKQYETN